MLSLIISITSFLHLMLETKKIVTTENSVEFPDRIKILIYFVITTYLLANFFSQYKIVEV